MLRGALIGLGNVAVHGHLPGLARAGATSRSSPSPTSQPDAAGRVPARACPARAGTTRPRPCWPRTMLDFVDICTPPSSHAALIEARARARPPRALREAAGGARSPSSSRWPARRAPRARVLHTVHNWHHAPIVPRDRRAHPRGPRSGAVTRVTWHTLRTQPGRRRRRRGGNWRLDPAVAGGGVLTDHGWHVFYVVQRWVGAPPDAVSARLETRRAPSLARSRTPRRVRVHVPGRDGRDPADVGRRRRAELGARDRRPRARIELERRHARPHARTGASERHRLPARRCPTARSIRTGSAPVADEFLAEVTGRGRRAARNLAEAALCIALECARARVEPPRRRAAPAWRTRRRIGPVTTLVLRGRSRAEPPRDPAGPGGRRRRRRRATVVAGLPLLRRIALAAERAPASSAILVHRQGLSASRACSRAPRRLALDADTPPAPRARHRPSARERPAPGALAARPARDAARARDARASTRR